MSPDRPLEVEWQFDAPDLEAVDAWLRAQPAYAALTIVPSGDGVQHDTYYDSTDWRVYLAGYSFRLRERGVGAQATLKSLGSVDSTGPIARAEINEPIPDTTPPTGDGPVASRLRLLLCGAELGPLFTVRTHRRTWDVRSGERAVAEIALDYTTVEAGTTSAQLRRVEIEETDDGGLNEVEALVEALRTANGLVAVPGAKFAAGLAAAGLYPAPPDLGPHELSREDTSAARALIVLRWRFSDFLAHESGTALGEDPEQLHDMRVAARRLRAAFRVFRDVLPPALVRRGEALREIGEALGSVRDLDVQIERFEGMRSASSWDDANAIAPLVSMLREQREPARNVLLDLFMSDRYRRFVAEMRTMLAIEASTEGTESADDFARAHVRDDARRFIRAANALEPTSPHAEYHELRKRGKRLRYLLEFFADCCGTTGARALRLLRVSQDRLGELQDLEVTDDRLRELVRAQGSALPVETLVMIGRLTEQHSARGESITSRNEREIRPLVQMLDRLRDRMRQRRADDASEDPEPEFPVEGSPADEELRALVVAATRLQPSVARSRGLRNVLARLLRGTREGDR